MKGTITAQVFWKGDNTNMNTYHRHHQLLFYRRREKAHFVGGSFTYSIQLPCFITSRSGEILFWGLS
jgi:hypothetical protein